MLVARVWSISWSVLFIGLMLGVLGLIFGGQKAHSCVLVLTLILTGALAGLVRFHYATGESEADKLLFSEVRTYLSAKAEEVIGGPERAIFVAMVFGYENDLTPEIKQVYNRTGTRHILAISGLNITIVAVLIFQGLILVGLWRRQAFWVSLLAILLFVLLVGAPASATRAGIMAALYLVSQQAGRLVRPWRLLGLAALVMVLIDPYTLFDLGFQLSCLAVFGLIFFKPFFDRVLRFVRWDWLRDLFSVSLAAQLATWPLIAHTFGTFSISGIFANLVAVPLMPFVMMLGMAFLLVGWWHTILAKVILYPVWVILHWVYRFLEWTSATPYALVEIGKLHAVLVLAYFGMLIFLYIRYMRPYGERSI